MFCDMARLDLVLNIVADTVFNMFFLFTPLLMLLMLLRVFVVVDHVLVISVYVFLIILSITGPLRTRMLDLSYLK